jgi:hypothetical protein
MEGYLSLVLLSYVLRTLSKRKRGVNKQASISQQYRLIVQIEEGNSMQELLTLKARRI